MNYTILGLEVVSLFVCLCFLLLLLFKSRKLK